MTAQAVQSARLATEWLADEGVNCPRCGCALEVIADGLVGVQVAPKFSLADAAPPTYRMEPRPFVACSGCEFCLEIGA